MLRAVGPLRVPDVIMLARRRSGGTVNLDEHAALDALVVVATLGAARMADGGARWSVGRGWTVTPTDELERLWVREYAKRRPPPWEVQFQVDDRPEGRR